MARATSRRVQRVENRLVVLVHQDRDRPTSALVQRPYQVSETGRRGVMVSDDLRFLFQDLQLVHYFLVQVARFPEVATAEAEAQHGMPHRPVPPVVYGEPLEQRLVALEQLLAGIEEQALAEAPRARQEVVLSLVEQLPNVSGLVHVVAVPLPDLAEGLHADGQLASSHGHAHGSWSPAYILAFASCGPVAGGQGPWWTTSSPAEAPPAAEGEPRAPVNPCPGSLPSAHEAPAVLPRSGGLKAAPPRAW